MERDGIGPPLARPRARTHRFSAFREPIRPLWSGSAASAQNAGTTAPWYFSRMKRFTASECKARTSFCMASPSLLSGRATSTFT